METTEITIGENLIITSESLNELDTAFSLAQGKFKRAKLDAENPFLHNHYATLGSIWDAIREPLAQNGLSIIQLASCEQNTVTVTTKLSHKSGQFILASLTMNTRPNPNVQEQGSVITYAKRYALMAITGVSGGDDDDGEANAQNGKKMNRENQPKTAQNGTAPNGGNNYPQNSQQRNTSQNLANMNGSDKPSVNLAALAGVLANKKINIEQFASVVFGVKPNEMTQKQLNDSYYDLNGALNYYYSHNKPAGNNGMNHEG